MLRIAAALAVLLGIGNARPPAASAFEDALSAEGEIRVQADRLDYNRETGLVEATGNVAIDKGAVRLTADYATLNTETEQARAIGNVVLTRGADQWYFDELTYDFKQEAAQVEGVSGMAEPFRVDAERVERSGSIYVLHHARVTTCEREEDHTHYHIRARRIELSPGKYMKAKGAVWYFGQVPVMYMPYWYRDLERGLGFHLSPGFDSNMGAYLLTSYRYPLADWLEGETHLDYRTLRGWAVGQDVRWLDPALSWSGDIRGYYLDDKRPIDADEDLATSDIDSDRWRLRVRHHHSVTTRDTVMFYAHWLSDTDILEDFFEGEYRRANQPDNYLVYTHRGDWYTASLLFRKRLNDFYSRVERLPEASFSVWRQQLGNSRFYYENANAATYLRRVWAEDIEADDLSIVRADSRHTFYRPFKMFGFLNLLPRAGYRGTWYDTTLDEDAEETGAKLRSRFEVGQEASFKAFKQWRHHEQPMRHVAEPYVNYTYVPEPNVLPAELYQFDGVDRLGKEHWARIGMRNKLQTKRNGYPFDLVDADLYTIYLIEREDDQKAIEQVFMDTELRLVSWMWIDLDGVYHVPDGELQTFNTQLGARFRDVILFQGEHRFQRDAANLFLGEVTFLPGRPWVFHAYGRYEEENSRLEEAGGYLQRNLDCMAIRTGFSILPGFTRDDGTQRDDEWRVGVELWLTDFPETQIGARYRN